MEDHEKRGMWRDWAAVRDCSIFNMVVQQVKKKSCLVGKNHYLTVVMDVESGAVVFVGDGQGKLPGCFKMGNGRPVDTCLWPAVERRPAGPGTGQTGPWRRPPVGRKERVWAAWLDGGRDGLVQPIMAACWTMASRSRTALSSPEKAARAITAWPMDSSSMVSRAAILAVVW